MVFYGWRPKLLMPITRKIMGLSRGRVFTGALSSAGFYTTPTYTFGSVVSPDGKNIYCPLQAGIQILNRNVSTGALTTGTNISTVNKNTDRCCISPDGKHVYLCLTNDHWIRLYNRDLSTGELTYVADYNVPVVGQLKKAEISPDGNSVHAYRTNNIYVLQRNSNTGALTYSYNYAPSSNDTSRGVFSPDGLYYYNLGYYGDLFIYSRTPATGQLTFISNSLTVGGDAKDGFMTSGGLHMYVANNYVIKQYSRNTTTGLITFLGDVTLPALGTNGCGGCCISSDNKNVYYVWINIGYVSRFDRDDTTGLLTYNSSIYVGAYYPTLAFMPSDGGNVYVDNNYAGLITITRS